MTETHETPETPRDAHAEPGGQKPAGATTLFDSLRDALDDLSERATPAVREVSARAAELTAVAAAKAAPFARKAGDATADASGKLAERSRTWAAELRLSIAGEPGATDAPEAGAASTGTATATADPEVHAPATIEVSGTPAAETNGIADADETTRPPEGSAG